MKIGKWGFQVSPWLPWVGWEYPMTKATLLMLKGGFKLYWWGVMIPIGRNTGIHVAIVRRKKDGDREE